MATKLGPTQRSVLNTLSKTEWAPATMIRDKAGMRPGSEGTRQAHGVLRRLIELGFVKRKGENAKARKFDGAAVSFAITAKGKKAL